MIQWLIFVGMSEAIPAFQSHSITGPVLSSLNEEYLREIGISMIGLRLKLLTAIQKTQSLARTEWRNTTLWSGYQYRAGPCNNMLWYGFPFCFDTCTGKPDEYNATNGKLNITEMKKNVNFPGCACFGKEMRTKNLDLADVQEIDTLASTSLLGDPEGSIILTSNDLSMTYLFLRSSECVKVSSLLMNAKEEATIMEGFIKR